MSMGIRKAIILFLATLLAAPASFPLPALSDDSKLPPGLSIENGHISYDLSRSSELKQVDKGESDPGREFFYSPKTGLIVSASTLAISSVGLVLIGAAATVGAPVTWLGLGLIGTAYAISMTAEIGKWLYAKNDVEKNMALAGMAGAGFSGFIPKPIGKFRLDKFSEFWGTGQLWQSAIDYFGNEAERLISRIKGGSQQPVSSSEISETRQSRHETADKPDFRPPEGPLPGRGTGIPRVFCGFRLGMSPQEARRLADKKFIDPSYGVLVTVCDFNASDSMISGEIRFPFGFCKKYDIVQKGIQNALSSIEEMRSGSLKGLKVQEVALTFFANKLVHMCFIINHNDLLNRRLKEIADQSAPYAEAQGTDNTGIGEAVAFRDENTHLLVSEKNFGLFSNCFLVIYDWRLVAGLAKVYRDSQ